MALGPIAPWLGPADPIRAAQAGASVGLAARGQDIAETEAGDRLRLAYTQLQKEEEMRTREAQAKQDLAKLTLSLRAGQAQDLMRHRAALEQVQQQRATDLNNYRNSALAQAAINTELRKRNIHFAPNGQILKVNDDGTVEELRKPSEKLPTPREATFTVPLDPNNPLGPKLSGPLSDPEIKKRFDEAQKSTATTATGTPTGFELFHPSTWFGGAAKPTAPAPAPEAPRTATGSPYKEGTVLRLKESPNAVYKVINGVPIRVPEGEDPNTWGGG